MLGDSVDQEFEQDTVGIAHLCSQSLSKTSAEKFKPESDSKAGDDIITRTSGS